jgi:hypothetical protein
MVAPPDRPRVLILTPVKNAAPHLSGYVELLEALAFLRPRLEARAERIALLSRDYGFQIPDNVPRWEPAYQRARRATLARARNQLLFRTLDEEDWVLWIDVDIVAYPPDILHRLIQSGCDLVTPRCVKVPDGPAFDLNAWGEKGRIDFDHTDGQRRIRLDAVGGTMLLVKADLHRDGLVFPSFPYGAGNPRIRDSHPLWGAGELETEGLGIMANDMGVQAWGLCDIEIVHAPV